MKLYKGKVISKKMEKTATVAVERVVVHPMYKKRFRRTKNYHVHDELETKVGEEVLFTPSRPISKTKRWKIVQVVGTKSKKVDTKAQEKKVKTDKK